MAHWDVLGLGAIAVDDLLYVERFPAADSKTIIVDRQRHGGGLAGTALVAAARLGVSAAYAGLLGEDELSRFTIQAFERDGVSCEPALICGADDPASPVLSTIIVDQSTGSRAILASYADYRPREAETITPELIASCDVLFIDHSTAAGGVRAAELARAQGIPVVADVERLDQPYPDEIIAATDHLIVGIDLAAELTGSDDPVVATRRLAAAQARACVAVTSGDRGCWFIASNSPDLRHQPALPVEPVDTTGCGDVFHGAYAAALARGLGPEEAIRVATVTAALKATQPGGRAGIPTWDVVQATLPRLEACGILA